VVASALLLHGKKVSQSGADLTAAGSSGAITQSLRLKGMTEAIEERAIQTPLLAGGGMNSSAAQNYQKNFNSKNTQFQKLVNCMH
jgi:hypothetical protein